MFLEGRLLWEMFYIKCCYQQHGGREIKTKIRRDKNVGKDYS